MSTPPPTPPSPVPSPRLNAQGLPEGYNFRPEWEVTPRDVKRMLDAGDDFLLLDCRTPGEYQVARIAGARLLPIQEVAQRLEELDDQRDRPIVVHCHHGHRSLQMAMFLRQQGFKDVKSMAAGIDIWAVDIDPAMRRY